MAGLNLRGTLGVNGALSPSSDGTIAGYAYGAGANAGAVSGDQRPVAGMGSIGAAAVCGVLLVWIWWSLPQ